MTVTSFVSIKGAPGVTTLACLVGATWPEERKVMVAECDPSGGDLAARFELSSREGWPALLAAARRSGTDVDVVPHLQQLPGGLDVLVATRGLDALDASRSMNALLSNSRSSSDNTWDVLIDLGRLAPDDRASAVWLEHSDVVVVCSRSDAASVMHIRERAPILLERYPGRVRLAIVGGGDHSISEIQQFTGIPVLAVVPFDSASAAAATGERQSRRRLRRSQLAATAERMATALVGRLAGGADGEAVDGMAAPAVPALGEHLRQEALQ
jgi:MinD-like ATPase involved in chromosome partitioning or flagellar assembly